LRDIAHPSAQRGPAGDGAVADDPRGGHAAPDLLWPAPRRCSAPRVDLPRRELGVRATIARNLRWLNGRGRDRASAASSADANVLGGARGENFDQLTGLHGAATLRTPSPSLSVRSEHAP
jgi:hypothetical protein